MNISAVFEGLKKRKRGLAIMVAAIFVLYMLLGGLLNIRLFKNDAGPVESASQGLMDQDVQELMQSSTEKLLNGNIQGALDDIDKAIQLAENVGQLYLLRGNIHVTANNYDLAIQDYTHALSLDPTLIEIYELRGHLYYEGKDYDNALKDYDKALQHNPNNGEVLLIRFNIHLNQENYDYALNDIYTLIELEPENGTFYSLAGDVHSIKGEYDKAIEFYNTALDYLSNITDRENVYLALGNCSFELKMFDSAVESYSNI